MIITIASKNHGVQAPMASAIDNSGVEVRSGAPPAGRMIFFGFQRRRNRVRATIEDNDARTSTAYGPQKLATANCTEAKLMPATNAAGQASLRPFRPARKTIR